MYCLVPYAVWNSTLFFFFTSSFVFAASGHGIWLHPIGSYRSSCLMETIWVEPCGKKTVAESHTNCEESKKQRGLVCTIFFLHMFHGVFASRTRVSHRYLPGRFDSRLGLECCCGVKEGSGGYQCSLKASVGGPKWPIRQFRGLNSQLRHRNAINRLLHTFGRRCKGLHLRIL